ncbi:BadF/BadG/BcrA/BcrD ATPase family protein [Arthrobacter sp. H35-D1]|uniref:N-acetylglucosamine kinase n=1 Tax=Arthrobacter sp. H35-D1 TaxID=3046202 RepID=UPI0024BA0E3F|nr:BadF/BadG/BcrA/BcrD ATPase family protein [Arthrobacter sp. H35-D1]MDJ0314539.1 BadF/BadG/BcrA/BcrD ATPase family protein [Arthrobacter sp. H35-D1]
MDKDTLNLSTCPTRFVGLDIGGSKTRGIVWTDGAVSSDHSVGSTNVQNVSVETARENMADLFAHLDVAEATHLLAGAGGVDTDDDAAALRSLIAPFVPVAHVSVVHDTRLLLAASGATEGVAVIAGTGSAAWGINAAGEQARAGGWGYLLGDEGSGYWLGREAVRHSLRRMDSGEPADELTAPLLEYCGLSEADELIRHFHQGTTRRYWAAASPVIFTAAERGHVEARAMVAQAAADLAAMAGKVAHQLGIPGPVVLGSGMGSNVPALQEAFKEQLTAQGLHNVQILQQDPIFGIPLLVASEQPTS